MIKKLLFLTACVWLSACSFPLEKGEQTNPEKQQVEHWESSPSKELESAIVTRIVDGDTLVVQYQGEEDRVRLLLVDTPETKHPDLEPQPFGDEASSFAQRTLEGKTVQIEFDGPLRDQYDRLLAYIWIDGQLFNEMLLREGFARYAYEYDPPYSYSERLHQAEQDAKNQEKAIWSVPGYVSDDGFKRVESNPTRKSESDKDCTDFQSQKEAQQFYEDAGGPTTDFHQLDGNDQDGFVCENLP
ncbi:thermonuclease family protein [Radiobacillus kanasensis]|uniref:thermonuclease family protein n=1 Tax=Radiobacillus kanasensis TaxID=2844358 RepID=UPI001E3C1527|nr:thermonuclease family protein [Radiobacillus kanasensis]UFU00810.1 thermonuclease family protein [Radiobacillus kanasensis]